MTEIPDESETIIKWGINTYKVQLSDDLKLKKMVNELYDNIGQRAKSRGYLTKKELNKIAQFTNPMNLNYFKSNNEVRIRRITQHSFNTKDEQIRLHTLTLLRGVGYQTSTIILAIVHPHQYAIYNRANWKILEEWGYFKIDIPKLDPEIWNDFCVEITKLAKKYDISPRDLNNAFSAIYGKYYMNNKTKGVVSLSSFFE